MIKPDIRHLMPFIGDTPCRLNFVEDMLHKLTLRNFRAFRNQTFAFGRINVFVGPNNSGKSSALSALNLIAQTVTASDVNETPLILNGPFESLGTYIDMVHGKRSNTPMGFDLGFDEFEIRVDFKYRTQRREIEIVRYELYENGTPVISYSSSKDSFDLKILGQDIEKSLPNIRKFRPTFSSLTPNAAVFISSMVRRRDAPEMSESVYSRLRKVERSISLARMRLRRSFANFDSLSPFREKPERTYLYSGEIAHKIGTTGANTAALLAGDTSRRGGESKGIEHSISRWFKVTGIAEAVQIESISPRHFEIVLVDFNGQKHNISDVGFGCSQVLPVLAATLNTFLSRSNRGISPTLIIQEPEIHLHPNAQASLGSFFAGIVPSDGQLFLETHSDNLILRLARHVADGTISNEDLRLFFVNKDNSNSIVYDLKINEDGTFGRDWPGGFFPQRQTESLALAQQSQNAKDSSRREIQLILKYEVDQ